MPTKTTIRGINPELYQQARLAAAAQSVTIGAWLNAAIRAAVHRGRRKASK